MDFEAELLSRFSSLGTTDHDVLIAEFRKFVGDQTPELSCAFFLDMHNWNLQEAIGAYYDYKIGSLPQMSLEGDITTGDGESVPPNTHFTKTWRVKNTGTEPWPLGASLQYIGGDRMGYTSSISLPPVPPGQLHDISVGLVSPSEPGTYQSQWQMCTPNGIMSADIIWVVIRVEQGGVLGITQQFSSCVTTDQVTLGPTQMTIDNPFNLSHSPILGSGLNSSPPIHPASSRYSPRIDVARTLHDIPNSSADLSADRTSHSTGEHLDKMD